MSEIFGSLSSVLFDGTLCQKITKSVYTKQICKCEDVFLLGQKLKYGSF